MILKGGIPGVIAKPGPNPGHGITPAQIASAGTSPSPLLNDVDPGDTLTELIWALLPTLVASGTTQVNDSGGYALLGAADGTWAQGYRLLAMPAAGATYVGESSISTLFGAAPVAPSITVQPQPRTVTEGSVANFSVTATGTSPISYQWRINGAPISGATSSTYSRVGSLADSGALISVVVTNSAGSVTSSTAALVVNPYEVIRVADPDFTIGRGEWNLNAYRVRKQPREARDIIIEMAPWFLGRADDPASVSVVPATGVTVTAALVGTRINMLATGGSDGQVFNVPVLMQTNATPPVIREFDLIIEIQEVQ